MQKVARRICLRALIRCIPLQLLHLEDVASIQKFEWLRSLASLNHFNNFLSFGTLSTPVIRSDFPSSTSAFSNGAEINPLGRLGETMTTLYSWVRDLVCGGEATQVFQTGMNHHEAL